MCSIEAISWDMRSGHSVKKTLKVSRDREGYHFLFLFERLF
jgi:hypothetical protein